METVNSQLVWLTNPSLGAPVYTDLNQLIRNTGGTLGPKEYCTDPTVVYWYWNDRFAVNCDIAFGSPNRFETFISFGNNPSAGWCRYEYRTAGNVFLDSPSLTVTDDKLVIGGQGDKNGGLQLVSWDKANMLSCGYAVWTEFGFGDSQFRAAVHQVDEYDAKFISCCVGFFPTQLAEINVSGTTGAHNISATEYNIASDSSQSYSDVVVPGGRLGAGNLNNRIRTAVQSYENDGNRYTMLTANTADCGGGHTGIELMKLNANVQPMVLMNDHIWCGPGGSDFTYPGAALDAYGNIYVSMSRSWSSSTPEADYYAFNTSASSELWGYILHNAGSGLNSCGNGTCNERWGDYLGAAQDQGNGNYVWGAPDYQNASGEAGWATVIARGYSGGCC